MLGLPVDWLTSATDLAELGGPSTVAERVADQLTLLVLDGGAPNDLTCALLTELLQRCSQIRVLVTATEPFPGAVATFPLQPLRVPESDQLATVAAAPSAQLLLRRLRQLRPGFTLDPGNCAVLAELCRMVDGLPRVVNLLAQWLAFYEPAELLRFAKRDAYACLRSLAEDCGRDALYPVRQSLASLTDDEERLLAAVGDFDGCWTVSDVESRWDQPLHVLRSALQGLLLRGVILPTGAPDQPAFTLPALVKLVLAHRYDG